jgi:hypothetical protein
MATRSSLGKLIVALAVLLAGALALHGVLGDRSPAEPARRMAAGEPVNPWWRTRFPPASVNTRNALPDVKFERAKVLSDLSCGSLDGVKETGDGGVFVWGWAFDPRTLTPARAVLLLDNGRQIAPPIGVFRERPDVAALKGDLRLLPSGWNVSVPESSLTGGPHVFEAFAVFEDHKLGPLGGKISLQP